LLALQAAFTRTQFQIDTVTSFRNRIKKYTVSKRLHENDVSFFSAITSWPRHVLLPGIWRDYTLKRRHFVLKTAKRKDVNNFVWTDDEVELLLRITNEYKVAKSAENLDWESVHQKYKEILERFKEQKFFPQRFSRFFSGQTEAVFKKTRLPPFTRHTKPYRFENAPLSTAFPKRCGFINYSIVAV